MRVLTWRRLRIGLFCTLIIGMGALTIATGAKTIVKGVLQEGVIQGITNGVNEDLVGKNQLINLYGLVERLLGKNYIKDSDITYDVIKDNNGQLQFITFQKDLTLQAQKIIQLNNTLSESGIPYVYVQTPLKVIEDFTQLPKAVQDYAHSNTNTFLQQLDESGVPILDLRDNVKEDGLDLGTLFFNTDHHWQTETAFWAVQKLVDYLAEEEGIDLDPKEFYTDSSQYRKIFYKESFLGSQGRRVGRYFAGVDDYTLMVPEFDTDYSVTINKSDSSTTYTGAFEESIVKQSLLEDKDVFTNRYAAYFGGDYPEVIIKNNNAENDMKILIVKDSFALPFSAFLSTMVGEIRMLDLRYYDQMSIEEYVAEYDIDLVLYVYKSMNA